MVLLTSTEVGVIAPWSIFFVSITLFISGVIFRSYLFAQRVFNSKQNFQSFQSVLVLLVVMTLQQDQNK